MYSMISESFSCSDSFVTSEEGYLKYPYMFYTPPPILFTFWCWNDSRAAVTVTIHGAPTLVQHEKGRDPSTVAISSLVLSLHLGPSTERPPLVPPTQNGPAGYTYIVSLYNRIVYSDSIAPWRVSIERGRPCWPPFTFSVFC